jgi:molybdopterin molybdotransferase
MKKEFLKSITPENALEMIKSFPVSQEKETVDIDDALERILAEDIVSAEDIPPFSRSLVDGYAVKVKDTQGAKETNPSFLYISGQVKVGEESKITVEDGKSVSISTGAMLPEDADGVVMEEYARCLGDEIEITKPVYRGENICFRSEDIKRGELLKTRGARLSPFDIGLCAALGISKITVYKRPEIAVISSGDEIVDINETPSPGKIRDINRYSISNIIKRECAPCYFLGTAKDNIKDIASKLESAKKYDMILVSGGSSKGERDFIVDAIEILGGKILFHGINIKPGKPAIFGTLSGKPVFGLPGHPVSCIMVVIRFVLPLLRKLKGEIRAEENTLRGILSTNVPSSYGIEEYVRIAIRNTGEGYYITPIFAKSSVISSLTQASGYIVLPEGIEGYEKGEEVEVYLF